MANMATRRKAGLLGWLASRLAFGPRLPLEVQRGRDMLAAIDAGGVPLNPARVNQIARDLGLEVSRGAAMEDTIERIRAAVARGLEASAAAERRR